MLTTLYYYQHYMPYMVKQAGNRANNAAVGKKKEIITEDNDTQTEVTLNKALNKEIVKYAKGIYSNTTDLKFTSKRLAKDIGGYEKYREFDEFDESAFKKRFDDDVEQFSNSYNKSMKFLKNQQHSGYLSEAADRLDDITENAKDILSVIGVKKDENGELAVDEAESTMWNGKNRQKKVDAAEKLFTDVYNETTDILNNPMAKHMNFKSLNYYYNYKADKLQVDSFQIIKTGLLVNLAL